MSFALCIIVVVGLSRRERLNGRRVDTRSKKVRQEKEGSIDDSDGATFSDSGLVDATGDKHPVGVKLKDRWLLTALFAKPKMSFNTRKKPSEDIVLFHPV
jgi:hypothetical protein